LQFNGSGILPTVDQIKIQTMGAGASDLSKLSQSTLHQEVLSECGKARTDFELLWGRGACAHDKKEVVCNVFKALEASFEAYRVAYSSRKEGDEELLISSIMKTNNDYSAYEHAKKRYVFEIGDIVQVRDPDLKIFVEGVVCQVDGSNVEVRIDTDDETEMENPSTWVSIDVQSADVRKVKSWNTLEIGDRVRVKDGALAFQGIIKGISEDYLEATVSFDRENDSHGLDDDIEYDEEDLQGVFSIEVLEKIDTGRFAKIRFRDTVRRVQTSIAVANAFWQGSPRRSPRTAKEIDRIS